jgi:hypothetical protein
MSVSALDRLIECQRDLLSALDSRDVASIETASAALMIAVKAAKSTDSWHSREEAKAKLDYALKQTDAARTRVNFLADWTCQKIDKLAELRGINSPDSYKNLRNSTMLNN